jgi:hypothetical protein
VGLLQVAHLMETGTYYESKHVKEYTFKVEYSDGVVCSGCVMR